MKRILSVLFLFCFSITSVLAKDMRFIQVDSALYSSANQKKFEKLIDKINNEKDVEFVVFTGDNLAKPNHKYLEEFLKSSKTLNVPFYIVLGNKDLNKQKSLGKKEYMEILGKNIGFYKKIKSPCYVFEKNKWVFIVVDGAKEVIPTSGGYYKPEVLEWLAEQLNIYKNRKVVILQHFPIVPPALKETKYTYKAENYLSFLADYSNVKAIISGNFDVNKERKVNGVLHISTANAPKYRIIDILDYETDAPILWSTIKN